MTLLTMTSHQMVSLCVVVYFLMTVSWASSSDCQDTWQTCGNHIISDTKSCQKQDYKANCKKTCGLCGDCQDTWMVCGDHITKNIKLCDRQDYKGGCKKTCGLCGVCSNIVNDCSKSNCEQNIWKVYCRRTCKECVDKNTEGDKEDETTTSPTTTTSSKSQYPPEITRYPEKQLFSVGETVTLTCKSRNTEIIRGALRWFTSRNDVQNIKRQVWDGSIQLNISQISTEYDGMTVTCVETGNGADTESSITIHVNKSVTTTTTPRTSTTTEEISSVWGQWKTWSQCSATCGDGLRSRQRTCSPTQGACPGEATETDTCNIRACCVPSHGQWSEWGSWSSCSVSCGRGTRTGSRTCYGPNACGRPCEGNYSTKVNCNDYACPVWGAWSSWTCSVTCGRGTESRTRTCTPPSATCSGDARDTHWCQRPECCVPRHGQWYTWGSWSSCSLSCGQGTRTRSRTCYGTSACGRPCEGNKSTEEPCNDYVCPGSPDMASLTILNHNSYHNLRCFVANEYAQEFELFKITSNGTRITRNLTSSTNIVDFKLEKRQCEDAGIYYCRARKGLKTANSTSVQLNIPCSPRRVPGTSTTPERIEVMEGSKGQYTFAVIAHPVPTIEDISYHTEDPVSSLKKEPVRSDFITGVCQQNTPDLHLVTCSLSITGALPKDDGLYSLKVSNSNGTVNVTFQLSVIAQEQSTSSLSWIGVVVALLILILIGALVMFFVMRRRAAQRKSSEDKKKMPLTATARRNLEDPVYYNVTVADVTMPSSAATMTSGTFNIRNCSLALTSPNENVYFNYEKKTSPKDSGESSAGTTSDDSPQDNLYAAVDKTQKSSSSENTGKPPKPAPMPKPKRSGSASRKSAENGGTGQSQNDSLVQESGDISYPTNEAARPNTTHNTTDNEEGLFYTELDFSQHRPQSKRPLPQKEETNYAAIDFKLQK